MVEKPKKKNIVLFDLDGTLTPPRKSISRSTVLMIKQLARRCTVGIVSGSPWSYIKQQAGIILKGSAGVNCDNLLIMPCNGTQLYRYDSSCLDYILEYELDMKSHMKNNMGEHSYKGLINHLLELQLQANKKIRTDCLTGNFISYRTSMINWAFIGRDACTKEREIFVQTDQKENIRNIFRDALRVRLDASSLRGLELSLGGDTSIDIYPKGWDKTHALRHCGDLRVWFIGDRCTPTGNDYPLWAALEPEGRAFQTEGPLQTCDIVEEKIIPFLNK